jgi:3' exoribonuclease, RNase T-like
MIDVMVDLETLGQVPGCSIISIGAVCFAPGSEELGAEFYTVVSRKSCAQEGLLEDTSTLRWWMEQSIEARETYEQASDGRGKPLLEALNDFQVWLLEHSRQDKVRVWGNGSDFDNAILACAYKAVGVSLPWRFWNNRCYRTIKNLFPSIKMVRGGVHHNALDDAKSQARHAQLILERMKGIGV